ncbi:MAG: hypothetical protein HWN68_15555 [Desulfobacterales bacterium]|nr:hypothetical protein [Desulfobacterales bacterium]
MKYRLHKVLLFFVPLLVVMLILTGCAPSILVPVTRPAEVNLRGLNRIAIGEITGTGGQEIAGVLTSKLFESANFEVLDRANLDRILKEQSVSLSGAMDEETVAKIGKLVGAAALIFGNVATHSYQLKKWREDSWTSKSGTRYQAHWKTGTATVKLSFQVVSLTTGKILAAKTITKQAERSTRENNRWPEDPDKESAMNEAADGAVTGFVKMIAPYTEHVKVKFARKDSDLPELERGVNFARAGRWSDAVTQFKAATEKDPAHEGAWWNLGLAYEYSFVFDKAEEAFNKANMIKTSPKYLEEINNVKRMAAERKKLKEQGAIAEGGK